MYHQPSVLFCTYGTYELCDIAVHAIMWTWQKVKHHIL